MLSNKFKKEKSMLLPHFQLYHGKLHDGSSVMYITMFFHSECCMTQCTSTWIFLANEAQ